MAAAHIPDPGDLPSPYPAVCHLSIIAEPRAALREALAAALAGHALASPLHEGGGTPSGRHCALRVSVRVGSRDELDALDRSLRAVPGVRMIL